MYYPLGFWPLQVEEIGPLQGLEPSLITKTSDALLRRRPSPRGRLNGHTKLPTSGSGLFLYIT